MSNYRLLGEDTNMKMMYETRVREKETNRVVVSVIFNNLTPSHMKDLEFNVLDSLNTKLFRDVRSARDLVLHFVSTI